jgi:DNA-directed RNA polymerase subunit H (RpoH/RPB5)
VEPILLKGPAIVRWLYPDDPQARTYIDADLLVPPDKLPAAERVLSELDFQVEELPWLEFERPHAKSWRRADGAVVDLHRVPLGCERLDPALVWGKWRSGAHTLKLGELEVLVPSPGVRLLALVLSVGLELHQRPHELTDLNRALATVDLAAWGSAAALAKELGLEHEAGYGLASIPPGAALADRLELPTTPPLRLLLDADPILRAVGHLSRIPSGRAKFRYLVRRLLPPPAYVREQHPRAASAAGGVGLAYLSWLIGGLLGVPRALVSALRAMLRRRV